MRIAVATSVILMGLAAKAEAAPSDVSGIATLFEAAGMVSDAVPTLVLAIDDVAAGHSTGYGIGELAYNAAVGTAYVQIALHADDTPGLVVGGIGSAVHGALAMHGLATIAEHRRWPASTTWVAVGSLVAGELFLPGADGDGAHGLAYRSAQVALDGALAAGYGYRAYVDGRAGHAGLTALAVAGGVLAAELAVDGMAPSHRRLQAVARAGLAPMLVDDGRAVALGLGVRRVTRPRS